jgi:hypothetical protein
MGISIGTGTHGRALDGACDGFMGMGRAELQEIPRRRRVPMERPSVSNLVRVDMDTSSGHSVGIGWCKSERSSG